MSFTGNVKNEISKLSFDETDIISELSALIRNISKINKSVVIDTENASLARRIFSIFKEKYQINPKVTVRRGYNFNKHLLYILEITRDIPKILSDLSIMETNVYLNIPKDYITDDEYLIRSYLRGVFLATGSINDPKTSRYHLEFLVDNEQYASFVSELLNHFNLNSKVLKRDNKYMIYIKEAEKIGDFLRVISATDAILYYEDIRIYRDHKNMTNRLNNCEQANVDKIVLTSDQQIEDINTINNVDGFELIDNKLKEIANYRLKYPDTSLQELSEIITLETGKSITKSGLYHRFNKIKEFANKIREKTK